jgi:hypothetical protein
VRRGLFHDLRGRGAHPFARVATCVRTSLETRHDTIQDSLQSLHSQTGECKQCTLLQSAKGQHVRVGAYLLQTGKKLTKLWSKLTSMPNRGLDVARGCFGAFRTGTGDLQEKKSPPDIDAISAERWEEFSCETTGLDSQDATSRTRFARWSSSILESRPHSPLLCRATGGHLANRSRDDPEPLRKANRANTPRPDGTFESLSGSMALCRVLCV